MLTKKDLIYPQLSYTIIGILFDVYNTLGPGHKEKYYQKAIALAFKEIGLTFREQVYAPLIYKGKIVGTYYLDFLIGEKVTVEIKVAEKFSKQYIVQLYSYLQAKNLQLGILACFSRESLKFKRILNIPNL